jgi:hypothetical protein
VFYDFALQEQTSVTVMVVDQSWNAVHQPVNITLILHNPVVKGQNTAQREPTHTFRALVNSSSDTFSSSLTFHVAGSYVLEVWYNGSQVSSSLQWL